MNVLEDVRNLGNGFLLAKSEIQASYRTSKKLINILKDLSVELNLRSFNTLTDSMLKAIASESIRLSE